jgi:cytochrome c oxidase assembly protein subunit 15
MALPRLQPATYQKVTLASLIFLCVIVVTGALVRLTDSGLGCSDWPNCNQQRFVDVSTGHGAIEQVNRLFTGVVVIVVALAVLGSLVRVPRRRDLTWLSVSLVVGVFGQAVVGGVVVKTDLNPVAVQQHFLLSMVIIAAAFVLHRRAGEPDGAPRRVVVATVHRRLAWAVAALTGLALITGTVVTGTGPHSGSVDGDPVRRFDFAITSVARVHSSVVIVTIAVSLYLMWRLRHHDDQARLGDPLSIFVLLAFVQGSIGYLQYFSGIPVMLVAAHVAFAMGVWLAALNLVWATAAAAVPASVAVEGLLLVEPVTP